MRIYIYGTGNFGKWVFEDLNEIIDILGFIDSDPKLHGNQFLGKTIYPPSQLAKDDFNYVIICSQFFHEIVEPLYKITPFNKNPQKIINATIETEMLIPYLFSLWNNKDQIEGETKAIVLKRLNLLRNLFFKTKVGLVSIKLENLCMQTSYMLESGEEYRKEVLVEKNFDEADHILLKRDLSIIEQRFEAKKRELLGDEKGRQDNIIFIGVSKSAGTYIAQSLAKRLGKTYGGLTTRIYPGGCVDFDSLLKFIKNRMVTHTHMEALPLSLQLLKTLEIKKLCIHFRDPRSALVSLTHHIGVNCRSEDVFLFHPLFAPEPTFYTQRFAGQLDYMIEHYFPLCLKWMTDWYAVYRSSEFDILLSTYEDFKRDPDTFFSKILNHYSIPEEKFSPEKLPEGKGHYLFRKGVLEEWRDRCNTKQIKKMTEAIPEEYFERFGWSTDI